jgi:hypothetical protein
LEDKAVRIAADKRERALKILEGEDVGITE